MPGNLHLEAAAPGRKLAQWDTVAGTREAATIGGSLAASLGLEAAVAMQTGYW